MQKCFKTIFHCYLGPVAATVAALMVLLTMIEKIEIGKPLLSKAYASSCSGTSLKFDATLLVTTVYQVKCPRLVANKVNADCGS